ncbi:unnamed protein product [Acanthoscelides obtectus]|uniref:Uncharacterized protein n=1 Tax=Acanthoscelides obtectus TaxID=200917 RepID=A0A9P0JT73_ACAOB|nr:unnamed protein product [Acanthoscelides obtectus]CAK1668909.1 hypothetical protein AOBTE_LOCUS26684 [Acanthoscelides obtectus]
MLFETCKIRCSRSTRKKAMLMWSDDVFHMSEYDFVKNRFEYFSNIT